MVVAGQNEFSEHGLMAVAGQKDILVQARTRTVKHAKSMTVVSKWLECTSRVKFDGDCLVKAWNIDNEQMQKWEEASDLYVKTFREDIVEKCLALPIKESAKDPNVRK